MEFVFNGFDFFFRNGIWHSAKIWYVYEVASRLLSEKFIIIFDISEQHGEFFSQFKKNRN